MEQRAQGKRHAVEPGGMTKSEGGKRTSNEGSESLEARATVTWVSPRVNRTPSLPSGGRGTSVVRKETQLDEMVYGRWGG